MKYFKFILTFIVFISIFILLNKLVSPKYVESLQEGNMTSDYYKSTKNHDIIFLGDCESYANISPMEIYENTYVKSYVRGNSQQMLWQSYYILKETLNYETPKVVFLSVGALRNTRKIANESYNRLAIDKMKWSKEKIDIINTSKTEDESFISYVFPIIRYHSRYSELKEEDIKYLFSNPTVTFNGFLVEKKIVPLTNLPTKRKLSNYNFDEENMEYLNKILELCNKNNIELVLFKSPSLYPYWYEEYDANIKEYASKNNIKYYNFINNIEEIGLDFNYDTYDGGLHLNLNGATKFSRFLSNIIINDFDIESSSDAEYDNLLYEYKNYIKD